MTSQTEPGNHGEADRHRDVWWLPLALPRLCALGVVRDCGRLHRVVSTLPSALESSGETGEKPGRQRLHGLSDPSGGACRVAYAFHVVALYPLLKFGIAVLVTLTLCFLLSGVIRKIPLVNRAL